MKGDEKVGLEILNCWGPHKKTFKDTIRDSLHVKLGIQGAIIINVALVINKY